MARSRGRMTIVRTSRRGSSGRKAATARTGAAKGTTNHDEIRKWAQARGGEPAMIIRGAKGRKPEGMLRIEFAGGRPSPALTPISWDEWFRIFEEKRLALFKQEGKSSRVNKLVSRD